jgi:NitT/TauT family transport system ATP-binding protein
VKYISIKSISKSYPSIENDSTNKSVVFKNFSIEIESGEFVTIFGPNACGKTTLLSLIAGLVETDEGSIEIGSKSPKQAEVGYIFQNYSDSLFPWRSCIENISFPLEIRGISKKRAIKMATDFVYDIGLTTLNAYENSYVYQLSGGIQQLVSIARAIIYKPHVLLMDEPFGSLDFQTRVFLQDQILKIWEKTKVTIVFVSHEINEALYLGNKMILLTKNPCTIYENIINDLPMPRDHTILTTMNFIKLREKVINAFYNNLKI